MQVYVRVIRVTANNIYISTKYEYIRPSYLPVVESLARAQLNNRIAFSEAVLYT